MSRCTYANASAAQANTNGTQNLILGTHPGVAIPMSLSRKGLWRCARTMATQTGMIRLRRTQGSRAFVCQRAVGEHLLPGYGSVDSVNRPVRPGECWACIAIASGDGVWCGGWGLITPGYPIMFQFNAFCQHQIPPPVLKTGNWNLVD